MSKSAFSLLIYSLYMLATGLVVMTYPNFLLGLFGVAPTTEGWIRLVGMLVFIVGYYDFMSARAGMVGFLRWSVYARFGAFVTFVAFVAFKFLPPIVILFGVVDAVMATWTAVALRLERATI